MNKRKDYRAVRFDSKTFLPAVRKFESLSDHVNFQILRVHLNDATWTFNTFEEFLAASDQGVPDFLAFGKTTELILQVSPVSGGTGLNVTAPTRSEIESVFAIFEADVERCRIPEEPEPAKKVRIFIGHGGDPQWRDLKDHLHEKHGYDIEAYEIGSRAGHTIRDILEEMLDASFLALLVMTGEDKTQDGGLRARQNVVHEAGLFQGRLGFSRAIVILEEGTEEFSNIDGLQQIRFSKGRIKETYGEVLAVLKRELR